MRKVLFALITILLVAVPVMAGEIIFEEEDSPKTEVVIDYWLGEFNYDHETADQNFLPSLTAAIDFNGPWTGRVELHDADSNTTENGEQVETKRFALAVQYNFEEGYYVTFGYQKIDYNMNTGGVDWGVDVSGVRLGVGYVYEPDEEPWVGILEVGFGITNNADVNDTTGGSEEVDSDTFDLTARIKYFLEQEGLFANGGYRYATTRHNITQVAKTYTVKGPFIGLGYEW